MPRLTLTFQMSWRVLARKSFTFSMSWRVRPPVSVQSSPQGLPRCSAFNRVLVDFLVEGSTRVTWELRTDFPFRGPLSFQLQVSDSGLSAADDWIEVGDPVSDVSFAVDATRRIWGKQLTTHYRVVLTDGLGNVYVSAPATPLGSLNPQDWIRAREILRLQQLQMTTLSGVEGFLLKRKRAGVPCSACVDPASGQGTDSNCSVCYGTQIEGGYFLPVPGVYTELPTYSGEEGWTESPEGTSLPLKGPAIFLGLPLLSSKDLWVDAASDLRYKIGRVNVKAQIRSLPLITEVWLEQLDFSDVAYKIPLGANGG